MRKLFFLVLLILFIMNINLINLYLDEKTYGDDLYGQIGNTEDLIYFEYKIEEKPGFINLLEDYGDSSDSLNNEINEDKVIFKNIIYEEEVKFIEKDNKIKLLFFTLNGCIWCDLLLNESRDLIEENFEVQYVNISLKTEEVIELVNKYNINGAPILIFLKNNKEINRIIGYIKREDLKKTIEKVIEKEK